RQSAWLRRLCGRMGARSKQEAGFRKAGWPRAGQRRLRVDRRRMGWQDLPPQLSLRPEVGRIVGHDVVLALVGAEFRRASVVFQLWTDRVDEDAIGGSLIQEFAATEGIGREKPGFFKRARPAMIASVKEKHLA